MIVAIYASLLLSRRYFPNKIVCGEVISGPEQAAKAAARYLSAQKWLPHETKDYWIKPDELTDSEGRIGLSAILRESKNFFFGPYWDTFLYADRAYILQVTKCGGSVSYIGSESE